MNSNSLYFFIINFFRFFFITIFILYSSLKLSNNKKLSLTSSLLLLLISISFAFILSILSKYYTNLYTIPILALFSFIMFFIIDNFNLLHSLLITAHSLCINLIIFFIATNLNYIISIFTHTSNYFISLLIIYISYIILLMLFFKIKKFRYGATFLRKTLDNDSLDFMFLNICIILFEFFVLLPRATYSFTVNIICSIIFFSILMAITIYKSFSLYYKHNLLVKELNDTKLELEKKDKEIERLEKENLEFSKTSHSIAHKQRVLEYKLNQLQLNTEFANELDLSDKLKEISDTYSSNVTNLTLPKTGIENIDDILEYMQSECTKNNINFELQLNGDIFSMVTTVINKEKLEILLADHIKNAIIAINSSENINKSILVRLGLINDIYSIYFYDSGIEFDENVLSSLGKEQITTHKDIGGTGCGFLNTFDTLKEFNASLEINEISSPCKDNYTKSIVIKFDGKNDFTINSYKKQE